MLMGLADRIHLTHGKNIRHGSAPHGRQCRRVRLAANVMTTVPTQPRWSVREPRPDEINAFLAAQAGNRRQSGGEFSYREVGATRDDFSPAVGYALDHNRVRIGAGERDFD